jgi:hypothetical protein
LFSLPSKNKLVEYKREEVGVAFFAYSTHLKEILTTFPWLERFQLAKEAFDGWAGRVQEFLDSEVDLTGEEAERADKAYRPYGRPPQ